jgi:hypothetical protein
VASSLDVKPVKHGKGGRSPSRRGSKEESRSSKMSLSSSTASLSGHERSWRKEIGLRAQWVIADKEKFTSLLQHLKGQCLQDTPPTLDLLRVD